MRVTFHNHLDSTKIETKQNDLAAFFESEGRFKERIRRTGFVQTYRWFIANKGKVKIEDQDQTQA